MAKNLDFSEKKCNFAQNLMFVVLLIYQEGYFSMFSKRIF